MHKIALIGAGRIGRIHAANVAAHPELQLAYVIDPVAEAAKSVAESYGAHSLRSRWRAGRCFGNRRDRRLLHRYAFGFQLEGRRSRQGDLLRKADRP
jgi:hypothetical protein